MYQKHAMFYTGSEDAGNTKCQSIQAYFMPQENSDLSES